MGRGKSAMAFGRNAINVAFEAKTHGRPVGKPPSRPVGRAMTPKRRQPSVSQLSQGSLDAERAEAGPGRKPLAKESARYQVWLARKRQLPAHAVSSRLTSWAFWFAQRIRRRLRRSESFSHRSTPIRTDKSGMGILPVGVGLLSVVSGPLSVVSEGVRRVLVRF